MIVYYNEIDPFCCEWLRRLMRRGLIPEGEIDNRSIEDVAPDDLKGFTQCHFFAGIGGWAYALRLAGWPDDKPVWTGSCPCQSFSAAGKRKGFADERHLWPAFFWLIGELRPDVVCGEQVASKGALAWLDLVRTDLEGAGYAVGVSDACAAGFGAPHIRQRLYWMALPKRLGRLWGRHGDARRLRGEIQAAGRGAAGWMDYPAGAGYEKCRPDEQPICAALRRRAFGGLADPDGVRLEQEQQRPAAAQGERSPVQFAGRGVACGVGDPQGERAQDGGVDTAQGGEPREGLRRPDGAGQVPSGVGDAAEPGLEGHAGDGGGVEGREAEARSAPEAVGADRPGPANGFWRDVDWLWCRDQKWRPAQPGSSPLADGLPEGVVPGRDRRAIRQRLKGYGNAIVIPQAVEFVKVLMEAAGVHPRGQGKGKD